jgi:hypothetical protein
MSEHDPKCDGCHKHFGDGVDAPVLHDDVWQDIADQSETLCAQCMFTRAGERRVYLSLASLKPCACNLFHWPHSWFNLFASVEPPPTVVDYEWRAAARMLQTLISDGTRAP